MGGNQHSSDTDGILKSVIGHLGVIKNPLLIVIVLGCIIFNIFGLTFPVPQRLLVIIITIVIFMLGVGFYCYLLLHAPGTVQEQEFARSTRHTLQQHTAVTEKLPGAAAHNDDDH